MDLSVEEGGSAGDEPAIIVLAPRHAVRPSSLPSVSQLTGSSCRILHQILSHS